MIIEILFNEYGLTETTVGCCVYLSDIGLAKGCKNREDLTVERFFANHFTVECEEYTKQKI